MAADAIPVVFDCTVFAQALINPRGPAGRCFTAAQQGKLILFVSEYVLNEVRELPSKLPVRMGVSAERVEALIADALKYARLMPQVAATFIYPRDPDDAHYVDLAVETGAMLVVSRDRDLLDLMLDRNAEGRALRQKHPMFRVVAPPELLVEVEA